jgi:hypothetical protein
MRHHFWFLQHYVSSICTGSAAAAAGADLLCHQAYWIENLLRMDETRFFLPFMK